MIGPVISTDTPPTHPHSPVLPRAEGLARARGSRVVPITIEEIEAYVLTLPAAHRENTRENMIAERDRALGTLQKMLANVSQPTIASMVENNPSNVSPPTIPVKRNRRPPALELLRQIRESFGGWVCVWDHDLAVLVTGDPKTPRLIGDARTRANAHRAMVAAGWRREDLPDSPGRYRYVRA